MNTRTLSSVLTAAGLALALALTPAAATADDGGNLFGLDLDVDLPWVRVGSDRAVYEAPRFESADGRLFVRQDDGVLRVYRGPTYTRIVQDNPDLGASAALEVLGQKIGAGFGIDDDPGERPSLRAGLQTQIQVPGMVYETSSWDEDARLYVTRDGVEVLYTGADLDAIVAAHPELREHAGYATLETIGDDAVVWRSEPADQMTGSFVRITRTQDGYTLVSHSMQDGRWQKRQVQARTLADLRAKDPAADRLIAAWGELDGQAPEAPAKEATVRGALLVEEIHGDRKCVVVGDVANGSFAQTIALQKGDILLSVNGEPTRELPAATKALAQDGELTLKVKRGDTVRVLTSNIGQPN